MKVENLRPELKEKIEKWIISFYHLDPRYKILTFFNLVAAEGADNIAQDNDEDDSYDLDRGSEHSSKRRSGRKPKNPFADRPSAANLRPSTQQLLANIFDATSILTVWRPCSNDAMRKMMEGTGVGKGLDIKGKSAKRGKLSAFVPFLQIHENEHKNAIQSLPNSADMRLYYSSKRARDLVIHYLKQYLSDNASGKERTSIVTSVAPETADTPAEARVSFSATAVTQQQSEIVGEGSKSRLSQSNAPTPRRSSSRQSSVAFLPQRIKEINKFSHRGWYGLETSQKLFWKATVVPTNITRLGTGTETGRPSTPGFQDANMKTLKMACASVPKPSPMPVVVQILEIPDYPVEDNEAEGERMTDEEISDEIILQKALDPLHLVMAYEECGTVTPVVSDFDGFLLGWRREALWFGCNLPREQEDLMLWCVDQIERILREQKSSPASDTWTVRWLEVLKRETHNGLQIEMPEYGFGDPKSYSIMEQAALRLKNTGAVRHGSECFNYYFPQEIDEMFLLISDTLRPVPWRYVNVQELQAILSRKIAEGFVFPLNPKWILCDPGWKKLYDELMASEALYADLSKDVWYPPFSGVREHIDRIYKEHPNGFRPVETRRQSTGLGGNYSPLRQNLEQGEKLSGNTAFDLAELELDNYVRHSVKHALARQIMDAHLEDLDEESDDDSRMYYDEGSVDSIASRSSSGSIPRGVDFDSSKRTLFRRQRENQKVTELRYRSNEDILSREKADDDPEYAAAKASLNSSSNSGSEIPIHVSSTGSFRVRPPSGKSLKPSEELSLPSRSSSENERKKWFGLPKPIITIPRPNFGNK